MIGKIYINGTIGDFDEGEFTDLVSVVAQVNKQKDATSYEVYINSGGGYVSVGYEIYDYLNSLTKPIKTIGENIVASIATVIFMVGDQRELRPNTDFMIHLPSGGIEGTSEEILAYSDMMQDTEKKVLKFYNEKTGLTNEALKPFLSQETWLDPIKAFELGFSNIQPAQLRVIAKYNKPLNRKENMSEKQKLNPTEQKMFKGFMDKLTTMFGGEPSKNIVLQTANPEVEIDFMDLAEGEPITVDAKATIDGVPAEGEYAMPSGETYIFKAGMLSEIKPKENEENEDDEFAKLLVELGLMKAEKKELETKLEAKEVEAKEVTAKLETAKAEFDKFKAALKTNFDFSEMKTDGKNSETEKKTTSQLIQNLAKLKKNRK